MKLSKLTPTGRADKILKDALEIEEGTEEYEDALKKYRRIKASQLTVTVLLSASLITSITTTFGVKLNLISQIASYIGTTILIALYTGLRYLTIIYRETLYIRRELMIQEKA